MKWCTNTLRLALLIAFVGGMVFAQTPNINTVGGFEGDLPSYWTKGNEPAGATLTWATDQSRNMGHSLKITKAATSDSAAWVSTNMVDYWSERHFKNVDIYLGAYVRTSGVNTAPGSDETKKWYVSYSFYDSAGALIGTTKLPIDQTVASSSGWVADTNQVGETILPKDSWTTIIKFVGGKNATGTVWADDFMLYGRAGAWAGQDWNTSVGVPTGWTYWLPPNGGNDGKLDAGFENTIVTTEAAHTGLKSLKFNLPNGRRSQDAFVGTQRMMLNNLGSIKAGDVLRISVWLKASGLVPDSAALYPSSWSAGFTVGFFKSNSHWDGFNSVTGWPKDYMFTFPAVTSFDWTQYYLDVPVPDDVDAKALEVRLHAYSRFVGTLYWDDLTVEKLDLPQVTGIGGFEGDLPSYWTKGNEPAGATLTWATDQSRNMGHSLKITKAATSDSAAWISENMVDYWSERHFKNVDIYLGAYVRTSGVNTAPGSDETKKWYVSYSFYDSAGALIGTTKLPIDQTVASSSGWVADTNQVGETILPKDSWTTIIKFVGGKNATGTVWADDFMLYGRAGAWAGQDWNTSVGVPTGWTYWLPPNGGNDGKLDAGFENTIVTTEAAHTGLKSLKFNLPNGRRSQDAFVGTRRFLLTDVGTAIKAGDVLRISVWLKASGLVPDSAALYPSSWSAGFTVGFFKSNSHWDGFNSVTGWPKDYMFTFPAVTSFDWTQYYLDVPVPDDVDAKALEVRLHAYSRFVGTLYWDDLTVEKLDLPQVTGIGGFEGDLPSYWTKGNEPAGATLTWATDQSRNMGHSLKITKAATSDSAAWISENMVDYWSERHFKNVDIYLGAYVRTSGVNTAPGSDETKKWYVSYSFYDSAGALIGTTKLPIDQTVASSSGWVADTNQVGETILPKDSWTTIIKFVGGKNATGTVWADDFMLYGRAGAWAGQDWNTSVGVPTGWTYWLPPNGGNDGKLDAGFENTIVTTEAAHTGLKSLKFNLPNGRRSQDAFVGTRRYLLSSPPGPGPVPNPRIAPGDISALSSVKAGDILRISVWLKASSLVPDSAALYPSSWSAGFTVGFFKSNSHWDGFNSATGWPKDYMFTFPHVTSFDWTQYSLDVEVPSDPDAKALEVRLHAYSRFVGTLYWDDLTVQVIGTTTGVATGKDGLPATYELANNYPNPFNPSTNIRYAVPNDGNVKLVIYNVLGQEVRTLVDMPRAAGRYDVTWDGKDNTGHVVGTGVYFYRLTAGSTNLVKKMLLLK